MNGKCCSMKAGIDTSTRQAVSLQQADCRHRSLSIPAYHQCLLSHLPCLLLLMPPCCGQAPPLVITSWPLLYPTDALVLLRDLQQHHYAVPAN